MKKAKRPGAKRSTRAGPKRAWYDATLNVELNAAYRGHPTGFEGDSFFDYAFWLEPWQRHDPALLAILEADRTGNSQPIIDLLRSGRKWSDWGHELLADHMERHRRGKRGVKPTPLYARSEREAVRLIAIARADVLMAQGMTKNDALRQAEAEMGLNEEHLQSYIDGKIGAANRMNKRRVASKSTK